MPITNITKQEQTQPMQTLCEKTDTDKVWEQIRAIEEKHGKSFFFPHTKK